MVILVAAEVIVPFDLIKTNKKHLRNKTKHKRNKNIFWVISRNDCKKKKTKKKTVIIMAMELVVKSLYLGLKFIYQFSKIAGKNDNKAIINM